MKLTSSSFDLGQGRSLWPHLSCSFNGGKSHLRPRELKKEGRQKGSTQSGADPQAVSAPGGRSRRRGAREVAPGSAAAREGLQLASAGVRRGWGRRRGRPPVSVASCRSQGAPSSSQTPPALPLPLTFPTPEDNLSLTSEARGFFLSPRLCFLPLLLSISAFDRFSGKLSSNSLPYSL